MPQDAGAGEMNQPKRLPNPAYVYGPMIYHFPHEQGGENENGKSGGNPKRSYLAPILIAFLAIGGLILYMGGNGVDIGRLNFSRAISGQYIQGGTVGEYRLQPRELVRARVLADRLNLREGPGTEYLATYLLHENWSVSLLDEYSVDERGEVWARVLVETEDGPQNGWVSRRFLWL